MFGLSAEFLGFMLVGWHPGAAESVDFSIRREGSGSRAAPEMFSVMGKRKVIF